MKQIATMCLMLALLTPESQQMKLRYKSDDMDDLLEGVITNKHKDQDKDKPKGAVDSLVQEAYEKAMNDNNYDPKRASQSQTGEKKQSTEEEWAKLMQEEDPLAETDIYATEKKVNEPVFS